MKKLFIVLIAIVGAISVNAQEKNDKEKDLTAVVDSLSAKLDKLQNDYDYLWCEYKLNDLNHNLTIEANNLNIRNNELKIRIYHERFNYDLYSVMKQNYNSSVDKYNSTKEYALSLKRRVSLMMLTSNFTENEMSVLKGGMNVIDHALKAVEGALDLYGLYLDEYKKKW